MSSNSAGASASGPVVIVTGGTRPVAIVTGGTRGIGSGIAEAFAEAGYDLLLTYNSNREAADAFVQRLPSTCKAEIVGGDIALPETRDAIFSCLDEKFQGAPLGAMVHNAGQYLGLTSANCEGHQPDKSLVFGDGSLLDEDGRTKFGAMKYYQRIYGEAYVDMCERSMARMREHKLGGSLVGISSPGITQSLYAPHRQYSMPGAGKCIMEYSSRIFAKSGVNDLITSNVIVPGYTLTDAWKSIIPENTEAIMQGIVDGSVARSEIIKPRDIGNVAVFLCSNAGRFITGTVVPVDGGLHMEGLS